MEANPATAMDAIALGVLILSSLLALTRGFVRESLSIASFVVAALATIFTYAIFRDVAMNWIQSELVATILTAFVIFIGVYVIMAFITHKLSDIVRKNSHVSILDRTAGFVFGLVRGMILLALVMLGWNFLARPDQTPSWVSEARMYPAVHTTADALKLLIPNSRIAAIEVPAVEQNTPVEEPSAPEPVADEPEQGYGQEDRNILDQVVTTKLAEEQEEQTPDSSQKDPE